MKTNERINLAISSIVLVVNVYRVLVINVINYSYFYTNLWL